METLLESKGMALLVEFFLKSSLVLGIGLCLSLLFKKQSASIRHFLLSLSLVGLLVLPFLSVFMPGWQTNLLPSRGTVPENDMVIDLSSHRVESASLTIAPFNREHLPAANSRYSAGEKTVVPGGGRLNPLYRHGFTVLWCLVSGFLLLRILLGLYGALRLTRQGIPLKGYPWQQLFLWFSFNILERQAKFVVPMDFTFANTGKMSLKRKVRLVKSKGIAVPMTWGVLKPVVLMPPSSCQWPLEQCSSVLFHELSHVKRWDFLAALLCRISCCLYWFNPLSWMVFKRLRIEQEKACDEIVLQTGIKPSTYASSLLSMKQAIDNKHYQPIPALGMAGTSHLYERLTTILTKQNKLKEIKMKTKMMLLILIVLAVAFIGTAKPGQAVPAVTKEAAVTEETAVTTKTEAEKTQTAEPEQVEQTEKTEQAEKKKEKGENKEKKVTIIFKNGKKSKIWSISENTDGKAVVLKHFKGKKDIRCKVVSDSVMVITDEKDSRNFHIHKKARGKKGEYLVIESGEMTDEKGYEAVRISMMDKGDHYIVSVDKEEGKEHRVKIEILSDNEISEELLEKIKQMSQELQKNLPVSYKLETDFSKNSQNITFSWPLKLDKKVHGEALKHFSAFTKELKKLLSSSKGSKPIQKHIIIAPSKKESEV